MTRHHRSIRFNALISLFNQESDVLTPECDGPSAGPVVAVNNTAAEVKNIVQEDSENDQVAVVAGR